MCIFRVISVDYLDLCAVLCVRRTNFGCIVLASVTSIWLRYYRYFITVMNYQMQSYVITQILLNYILIKTTLVTCTLVERGSYGTVGTGGLGEEKHPVV